MTTFTEDMGNQPPSPFPLAAATALLVAAIVGVGLLLLQRDAGGMLRDDAGARSGTSVNVSQAAVEADRSSVRTRSQAATPATASPARTGRSQEAATVYIAGSPEEAERVRTGLLENEAIRISLSLPPLDAVVVVAGSAEESLALRLIANADAFQASLGLPLPLINLVDLRSP